MIQENVERKPRRAPRRRGPVRWTAETILGAGAVIAWGWCAYEVARVFIH